MKISWIPEEHLPLKGKFGLCRAPGSDAPNTDDDLDSLALQGVTRVVCLQQANELKLLEPPESIELRKESLNQRGIGFLHEPIQDFAAPSVEQAQRIVAWINTELERGEVVAVHCWAGLGRAGTIAACVLLSKGFSANGAVSLVRYVRPGAIQSDVQEKLIAKFAALTKSE
jgi:protein-tyrosine phosphatase